MLALDHGGAIFTQAVLDGLSLEGALQQAGTGFNFETWLILALRHDALAEVRKVVRVEPGGRGAPGPAAA